MKYEDTDKAIYECNECEQKFELQRDMKSHVTAFHEDTGKVFQSIFLSHHEEEMNDTQVDCNQMLWEVLLSEEEANELTETEKREIVKLHRYFANRSGRKLWQNLFQPAEKLMLTFIVGVKASSTVNFWLFWYLYLIVQFSSSTKSGQQKNNMNNSGHRF